MIIEKQANSHGYWALYKCNVSRVFRTVVAVVPKLKTKSTEIKTITRRLSCIFYHFIQPDTYNGVLVLLWSQDRICTVYEHETLFTCNTFNENKIIFWYIWYQYWYWAVARTNTIWRLTWRISRVSTVNKSSRYRPTAYNGRRCVVKRTELEFEKKKTNKKMVFKWKRNQNVALF